MHKCDLSAGGFLIVTSAYKRKIPIAPRHSHSQIGSCRRDGDSHRKRSRRQERFHRLSSVAVPCFPKLVSYNASQDACNWYPLLFQSSACPIITPFRSLFALGKSARSFECGREKRFGDAKNQRPSIPLLSVESGVEVNARKQYSDAACLLSS